MSSPDDDQRQDYDDRFGTPRKSMPAAAKPSPSSLRAKRIRIGLFVGVTVMAVLGLTRFLQSLDDARHKMKSDSSLKQIGLATHNYDDINGELPHNTYDPNGKPLLSWRVHLLPMLGENALHKQFKLDEPWDGPNNRKLVSQMPRVFGTAEMRARAGDGKSYYRGFSHQGAMFPKPQRPAIVQRIKIADITDGTANTIMIVEAGESVEWTKPDDIDWSPGRPLPPLGAGRTGDQISVLMVNGAVRSFRKTMAESNWRALITYNGNEVVGLD